MSVKKYATEFPNCANADRTDREIIHIFRQYYRDMDSGTEDARILRAIQRTADLTGASDAMTAKTLVDYGLRATREAFPQDYLDFVDDMLLGHIGRFSAIPESLTDLNSFWGSEEESGFDLSVLNTPAKPIPTFVHP